MYGVYIYIPGVHCMFLCYTCNICDCSSMVMWHVQRSCCIASLYKGFSTLVKMEFKYYLFEQCIYINTYIYIYICMYICIYNAASGFIYLQICICI